MPSASVSASLQGHESSPTIQPVESYKSSRLLGHPEWVDPCFEMLVALFREMEAMEPLSGARAEELMEALASLRWFAVNDSTGTVSLMIHEEKPVAMAAILPPESLEYQARGMASLAWVYADTKHRDHLGLAFAAEVRNLLRWARVRGYKGVASVVEMTNERARRLNVALGLRPTRQEYVLEF